jgi:hypothetical protein
VGFSPAEFPLCGTQKPFLEMACPSGWLLEITQRIEQGQIGLGVPSGLHGLRMAPGSGTPGRSEND